MFRLIIIMILSCTVLNSGASQYSFKFAISNQNSPPYSWIGKCDARHYGAVIDIVENILRRSNITLEKVFYNSGKSQVATLINDLASRKIDGVILSDGSYPRLTMSIDIPLIQRKSAIIFRTQDTLSFRSLEDLSVYKGGIVTRAPGSSGLMNSFKERYKALKLENIVGRELAFKQLMNKKYDYIISGDLVSKGLLWNYANNNEYTIREIPDKIFKPLYWVVSESSPFFNNVSVFQSELARMRKAGLELDIYRGNMALWVNHKPVLHPIRRK